MHRLGEPLSRMAVPVGRAQRTMAALGRLEIARYLAANPGSTIGEIVKGTRLGRVIVRSSLGDIAEIGFLLEDVRSGWGRHQIRYSVDRTALRDAAKSLAIYVFD